MWGVMGVRCDGMVVMVEVWVWGGWGRRFFGEKANRRGRLLRVRLR